MQNTVKEKVLSLLLELSLCRDKEEAIKWYKNSQLQSCGNKTAEKLVDSGHGQLVISHVEHVAYGGYT